MVSYLGRRLLQGALVVWGAVSIIFVIVRVVPGDPALLMLPSTAPQEQVDALRDSLGLSDPLPLQYLDYLASAARLDFGESYRLGGSAMGQVVSHLGSSLTLALAGLLVTVGLGIPLGVIAARWANSTVDRAISSLAFVSQGLPQFWVGIMLILIFARTLEVLPSAGADGGDHLILPALALGLPFVGWIIKMVRAGLLEELANDYVRTARAKGLTEAVVFNVHVLRNAWLPVVTLVGLLIGEFITSSVIVEVVFSWPGIGRVLIESITHRDYSVVQATMVIIAVTYTLLNLIVDLMYVYLDPRVRVS